MYSIYADGECIHSDIFACENRKALSPKLTLEDNSAGSLSIKLPPTNRGYRSIVRMITDISVRKDGEEIWAGRVLSESKDFWNNRELYCEGELAFFNDSTQPPAEHPGLSVRGYLEALIKVHNSKVNANRRFTIGAVTVYDDDFPTRYTNHEKTMQLLNGLIEQYGGHLRVRKANGVRYLDYLADYPDTCSQVIQFGSNLIDFTRKWDSSEYATAIVPLGNRLANSPIEALDAYLTVESVNNGSIYVQSDEAVAAYGWIEKTVTWNDVSDPAILLEKAKTYLSDLQFDSLELELSALDLHYLDVDTEAVKLLDEIRVISRPHGLDRQFPVTKLEIPLDSPEKTQFKLGDTVKTSLTSVNNQTSAAILQKIDGLPKAHSILKEAKENATAIMNMATTGYITITKDQYGSDTLYISNIRDYTKANKLWKWNMNGLGYSKDGGKTFGLAITMDGAIVADYITTGVLNADVIRIGVIRDYGSNVVFDLNEGKLTMKKGSINIGGNFTVDEEGNLYARRGTFAGTLEAADGHIGGFTLESDYMWTGSSKNFVAINGSTKNNSAYAIWAGAMLPEAAPFWVKKNGEMYAKNGTFEGTLKAARIEGTLVGAEGSWLRGCGISVGGSNYETGIGNFYVDEDGNVTMKGSIKMAGNITWSSGNAPCQVLYASTALAAPSGSYASFPNSSSGWHKTLGSRDYYASYTYNGGISWTSAIQIRGADGSDGVDGSDADVTRDNIWRAMLDAVPQDGLYSAEDSRGREVLLINATAIKTGTIDAGTIYLEDDNGCFCSALGDDGTYITFGAKMMGSDEDYYVIATEKGVRMTARDNSIYVARSGCFASEEITIGSDSRIKNSITYDVNKYEPFFRNLKPAMFRLNSGQSGRFHIGFIAQDVEEALLDAGMTTDDFAGFVRSAGEGDVHGDCENQCFLRYQNFIALNTCMIQSALKEIDRLRQEIQDLQPKEG